MTDNDPTTYADDGADLTAERVLSAAERVEASTRALADDLCATTTHPRDEEAGDFHCQDCYDLAIDVHESPWLARILAAPAAADEEARASACSDGCRMSQMSKDVLTEFMAAALDAPTVTQPEQGGAS